MIDLCKRISVFLGILLIAGCAAGSTGATPARAQEVADAGCVQKRKTPDAPQQFLSMKNPVAASPANLKAGEELFQKSAKPIACKFCHGANGGGKGDADFESNPPARNFTCSAMMEIIPDGQLFWIIQNGSPKTSMPPFKSTLSEEQTWQLVHYIRQFSK